MAFDTKLGTGKMLKEYDVRLVGIKWDVDELPYHRVLRVCSERVVKRGDNHQTLRPDSSIQAEHEAIVGQFLRSFASPDPDDFDRMITVSVLDDSLTVLRKVVDGLVDALGVVKPDDEALGAALQKAAEYKTTTPYHAPAKISKTVRYFGLAPEINLVAMVSSALKASPDASAQTFLDDLRAKSRITPKPHVTLSHENNVQAEKEERGEIAQPGPHKVCWDQCKSSAEHSVPVMYTYNVTHLAWDDRVMTLIIDTLIPRDADATLVDVPEDYAKYLHITVGTRDGDIPAFESRGVVKVAREHIAKGQTKGEALEAVEGGGAVRWISLSGVKGEGRIKGMW